MIWADDNDRPSSMPMTMFGIVQKRNVKSQGCASSALLSPSCPLPYLLLMSAFEVVFAFSLLHSFVFYLFHLELSSQMVGRREGGGGGGLFNFQWWMQISEIFWKLWKISESLLDREGASEKVVLIFPLLRNSLFYLFQNFDSLMWDLNLCTFVWSS